MILDVIGLADLAKYPFLDEVKNYYKEKDFSIDQFGTDSNLKHIADLAYERIACAILRTQKKPEPTIFDTYNTDLYILSFGVAMLLLKFINVPYFVRKFALSESQRSEKYMTADMQRNTKIIYLVLNELFDYEVTKVDGDYKIPVSTYLRHSTQFNEPKWKLVNRYVHNGFVTLTLHESVRLIRRDLMNLIIRKVTDAPAISLYDTKGNCKFPNFEKHVTALQTLAKDFDYQPVESKDIPPCVEDAIKTLETGQNLSHSGRFMMATFLLTKGWSVEDVVPLFKGAPDYDYKITHYQLSKIAQGGYKCPGCQKLRSQNLCRKTEECGYIINPLQFKKPK